MEFTDTCRHSERTEASVLVLLHDLVHGGPLREDRGLREALRGLIGQLLLGESVRVHDGGLGLDPGHGLAEQRVLHGGELGEGRRLGEVGGRHLLQRAVQRQLRRDGGGVEARERRLGRLHSHRAGLEHGTGEDALEGGRAGDAEHLGGFRLVRLEASWRMSCCVGVL